MLQKSVNLTEIEIHKNCIVVGTIDKKKQRKDQLLK